MEGGVCSLLCQITTNICLFWTMCSYPCFWVRRNLGSIQENANPVECARYLKHLMPQDRFISMGEGPLTQLFTTWWRFVCYLLRIVWHQTWQHSTFCHQFTEAREELLSAWNQIVVTYMLTGLSVVPRPGFQCLLKAALQRIGEVKVIRLTSGWGRHRNS